jgi:hypothetical protein
MLAFQALFGITINAPVVEIPEPKNETLENDPKKEEKIINEIFGEETPTVEETKAPKVVTAK